MQIAVIDLGIGNLRSVKQALLSVAGDVDVVISHQAEQIARADKVVLPGQGAIGTWFASLRNHALEEVIQQALAEKPLLGICVGMQAMFRYSEEDGGVEGLSLFDGSVRHFRHFHAPSSQYKIPQMGWNQVAQTQPHPLWHNIADNAWFYFVHSYCANLDEGGQQDAIYGQADYGHQFIAAIGEGNVFAVQFHPEKSHKDGLQLLDNFIQWDGRL